MTSTSLQWTAPKQTNKQPKYTNKLSEKNKNKWLFELSDWSMAKSREEKMR